MLIVTPKIDLNGERWFYPPKSQKAAKGILAGRRIAVQTSPAGGQQRESAISLIVTLVRRHIDKMDAGYKVGTTVLISPAWTI